MLEMACQGLPTFGGGRVRGSAGSGPGASMASKTLTASSTLRASGPAVSRSSRSGMMPALCLGVWGGSASLAACATGSAGAQVRRVPEAGQLWAAQQKSTHLLFPTPPHPSTPPLTTTNIIAHLLVIPSVGRSPTSAVWLAGPRTELPVSVPRDAKARLAATAAAEPPLDPVQPGHWCGWLGRRQANRVMPGGGMMPGLRLLCTTKSCNSGFQARENLAPPLDVPMPAAASRQPAEQQRPAEQQHAQYRPGPGYIHLLKQKFQKKKQNHLPAGAWCRW